MIARRGVVRVDEVLAKPARGQHITGHEQYGGRISRLDCPTSVLQHVDAGGSACVRVHQPTHTEPKTPGEIDRVVGTERERRDGQAVDLLRQEASA